MNDQEDVVHQLIDWLYSRDQRDRGRCYRCWQVGETARATCVVLHAPGTRNAWKCVSCDECADRDCSPDRMRLHGIAVSRVIARVLG